MIQDTQFEETTISEVRKYDDGAWEIKRADGWLFQVPADSPVVPEVGMVARFYGKGIGSTVRGLELDGQRIWYRTEAEQREWQEVQSYGADAADWLRRWDEGRSVWSVEMGGLGPGYEQCIQITAAEVLRHLLDKQYDWFKWSNEADWARDRDAIRAYGFANETIKKLGISGAQWGAAVNLASMFYRQGPRGVMADERIKDRHIQVSKGFPGA